MKRKFWLTIAVLLTIGACASDRAELDQGALPVSFQHHGDEALLGGMYYADGGDIHLLGELVVALQEAGWTVSRDGVDLTVVQFMEVGVLEIGESLQLWHSDGMPAGELRIRSAEWLDNLPEENASGSFPRLPDPCVIVE